MPEISADIRSVLLKFPHGLGDAAQFCAVLDHLRRLRPGTAVDVLSGLGKHSLFHGLCRRSLILGRDRVAEWNYDVIRDLPWWECHDAYPDCPSTKTSKCLKDEFGIRPQASPPALAADAGAEARADAYAATLPGPFVAIHYQGNTSSDRKDLPEPAIRGLCALLRAHGIVPVVLDWDGRSPLPDGRTIFNPGKGDPLWMGYGTGDGRTLVALLGRALLTVGIDSGPLHAAQLAGRPVVGVWTHHHPVHFADLVGDVTHLVPHDHARNVRGVRAAALDYFEANYRHRVYRDLADELRTTVADVLGLDRGRPSPGEEDRLRDHDHDHDAGTDEGGWHLRPEFGAADETIVAEVYYGDIYRIKELPLPPDPVVLDVGACIGAFSRRTLDEFPAATVLAIEANPRNHDAVRRNAPGAVLVPAALHYGADLALLDTVYAGTPTTGGSVVLPRAEVEACADPQYRKDLAPLPAVTFEALVADHGLDRIDIVKLDCEGCEHVLFAGISRDSARRIGCFVGEYHGGADRFHSAVNAFSARVGITYDFRMWDPHDHMGLFRMVRHRVHPAAG